MADQNALLAFFSLVDQNGGVIVRDAPKLDLEQYISNYTGRTRLDRLSVIGHSSVTLCVDALKAAVAEAKGGRNVQRYREVWEAVRLAAPGEPEAQFDQAWADRVEQENGVKTSLLEAELRGYKNNLVRESIRIGYRDLGIHLESVGDLVGAQDNFVKMRGDATTAAHIVEVNKHMTSINLQRRDWPTALANVSKIFTNSSEEEQKRLQPYVRAVSGLVNLHSDKFHDAAKIFLDVGDVTLAATYSDIMSPNDVATYGGLLALASMDRSEIQSSVLDNVNFRSFLELEPHIRKAVSMFVNGRYSACLAILDSYRTDYLLDIHLQKHVESIYSQIRSKAIVQYFIPFSCVTLESMNAAFAKPGESLEEELIRMIQSGSLKARINTIDKLLVAVSTDRRVEMQTKSLATAKNYEKEAIERIRRMSIIAADLEVKGMGRRNAGGMSSTNPGDLWYDETRRQMGQMTQQGGSSGN